MADGEGRITRVIAFRNHLLPLISRYGRFETIVPWKVRCTKWESGGFVVMLFIPFTARRTDRPEPVSSEQTVAMPRATPAFEYVLDIALRQDGKVMRKVVSLQWNKSDNVEILTFDPGAWEADLMTLSGSIPVGGGPML